jgi:hypothetical protein
MEETAKVVLVEKALFWIIPVSNYIKTDGWNVARMEQIVKKL